MKAIEIDAGDGCVAPTEETIADGSYPFSRTPVHLRQHGATPRQPGRRLVRRPVPVGRGPGDGRPTPATSTLPDDRIQATRDAWAGR